MRGRLGILLVLLTATIAAGWWQRSQERERAEENFKRAALEQLKKVAVAYQTIQQQAGLQKVYDELVQQAIPLAGFDGGKLARENMKASTEASIAKCEAAMAMRAQILSLENTIKEKNKGLLPQWLTQERTWQQADSYLRKTNFSPPEGGCRSLT